MLYYYCRYLTGSVFRGLKFAVTGSLSFFFFLTFFNYHNDVASRRREELYGYSLIIYP